MVIKGISCFNKLKFPLQVPLKVKVKVRTWTQKFGPELYTKIGKIRLSFVFKITNVNVLGESHEVKCKL